MLAPARRWTPVLLVAVAAALLAGCGSAASETSSAKTSASGVQARSAAAFVDSIGVNTHSYYSDTVYHRRFGTVERRLRQLGVRHVRENLVPHRPDQYRRLRRLAAAGIGSTLILGDPDNGLAGMRRLVAILASELAGSADAAEGPNEFDLSGDPDWSRRVARYQAALYKQVNSTPGLAEMPVIGPSLGQLGDQLDVPDLAPHLDYGNIHSYPDGEPPERNVAEWLAGTRRISGAKPVMATETGYHNAVNASVGQRPTSERAAAIYLPRLYLDYFRHGVVRTFPYELVDEFPDRAREQPESDFGLLRNDLSPKPAFYAIRNLVTILEDGDPDSDSKPGRLDYALSGDLRGLGQLLLAKRDGSFFLALWRNSRVWDPDGRRPVAAAAAPVGIDFAIAPDRVRRFLPNASHEPRRQLSLTAGKTSVEVGPRVLILEVVPEG